MALVLAAGAQLNRASFAFSRSRALEVADRIVGLLDDGDVRALAMLAALDPLPHAQQVADLVAQLDPMRLGAHADLLIGAAFVVDADPDLAAMQGALIDTYRHQGRLRSIARLQAIHSWTEITLANWPEAIQAADEGVRLARDIDDRQREAGAIVGQAMIAVLRGEPEAAELLREAERVAVSGGAQDVLTGVQLTRGVQQIAHGSVRRGHVSAETAVRSEGPVVPSPAIGLESRRSRRCGLPRRTPGRGPHDHRRSQHRGVRYAMAADGRGLRCAVPRLRCGDDRAVLPAALDGARCGGGRPTGHGCCCCTGSGCVARAGSVEARDQLGPPASSRTLSR